MASRTPESLAEHKQRQLRERKQIQEQARIVSEEYRALAENPAIEDLLKYVEDQHRTTHAAGINEIDNPYKAQAYLQRSSAYGTISAYIRKKLAGM